MKVVACLLIVGGCSSEAPRATVATVPPAPAPASVQVATNEPPPIAPSASSDPAPEPADLAGCSGGLPTEAQLGPARGGKHTTVAQLLRTPPRAGRFTLTAYAEKRHHCAPCPAPALCKPCEDSIWVFESFGTGLKQPFEEEADLVVHVANAAPFDHSMVRLTVVACPGNDAATKRPLLMLVGYDPPTK